mgnify:FL=1|tara:strand:+ start:114 stop:317 length:204 start_codon:yes stop_codon:yes gene_type:complete
MKKKVGRKKKHIYKSIFGDYDDKNLDDKVMTIPKMIDDDYGWEMQFGFKSTSLLYEKQYLEHKKTTQ